MGQYYDWVNPDKKEYLCPGDYDLGNKRYESCLKDSEILLSLKDLLYNEWRGDHIFWVGDYYVPDESTIEYFKDLAEPDDKDLPLFDRYLGVYKNVGGLFKATEDDVRKEIQLYLEDLKSGDHYIDNEYGVDESDPYKGLFKRNGRQYKYTLNHTKRIFFDIDNIRVFFGNNKVYDTVDPLPGLMECGKNCKKGDWVGDIIGVSDDLPEGYEQLMEIHLE